MKLLQSTLERSFHVKHRGKTYYISYLNSDGYLCVNRFNWEILDEELEEVCACTFKDSTKKEIKEADKEAKLMEKLINFCIKHFNDYQPDPEDC